MGRLRRRMPCTMPAACTAALLIGGAMFAGAFAAEDCLDPASCEASVPAAPLTKLAPGESTVSDLVGAAVVDRRGERLGTVGDVVLDRDMRVVALAVRVGWVLGVTTRTVAVPIGSIHPEDDLAEEAVRGAGDRPAREGGLAATFDALMAGGAPRRGDGRRKRLVSDLARAELLASPEFEAR